MVAVVAWALFDVVGWAALVMSLVVLLAVAVSAWHFFRGDVQLDDPGGSIGWQIFNRRKARRPEDWLKRE